MAKNPEAVKSKENKETLQPTGKRVRKPLVLFLGVLLLLTAGAGVIVFFAPGLVPESLPFVGGKGQSKNETEDPSLKRGHIYSLDAFIVNLADTEASRYLKVKIDIETQEAKESGEFGKKIPQLRDAILTLLTSKSLREISSSEGKDRLKKEILQRSNPLFAKLKVKNVYFTEFVVQ